MNYPIKLEPIQNYHLNQKNIDPELLKNLLQQTAHECPFSTFPYFYGNNSQMAQKKHKTGNCIALSMFLQNKLQKNNIKSILIPASIPKMYQMDEYLDLCHVAVAVLLNQNIAFICDPAFYFQEPMYLNLNRDIMQQIPSQNIYQGIPELLEYQVKTHAAAELNPFQTIPSETYYVHTRKQQDPTDTWNYFMIEVKNPDQSIGNNFLNAKKYPFITCINPEYQLELHIKFFDPLNVSIKQWGTEIYYGHPKKIPPNVHKIIKPCLIKHFGRSYRKIFKHDYAFVNFSYAPCTNR